VLALMWGVVMAISGVIIVATARCGAPTTTFIIQRIHTRAVQECCGENKYWCSGLSDRGKLPDWCIRVVKAARSTS
jgi:hypothetical protein